MEEKRLKTGPISRANSLPQVNILSSHATSSTTRSGYVDDLKKKALKKPAPLLIPPNPQSKIGSPNPTRRFTFIIQRFDR